ncbi:MarR family winged helix-turn-helix transcriptional regulator [Companilactobacillus nodensis]|uniref:Regulatory protein MarR n=2 Tax=Companilactobacillus nodensis TaxID=460870 RepID=A0A0R1KDK2_9LACO|nr:winged helix DNA-binding protein [Companilactobacillus nodensis]KRK79603.1 regulatory protein MarR [Companilactobacillus nodensis DSM 19682 = JCM 14932 = NBRC 107160]
MDDYDLVGFAVRFMMQRKRLISAFLKGKDLNLADSIIMMIVTKHSGYNQEKIGEVTLFDGAIIARSLKKLEAQGFVTREVDETNRRRKIVQITESGKEFGNKLRSAFKESNETIYSGITEEELKQLDVIMAKVYANLDKVKIPDSNK